jgi:hypothetical protein
VLMLIVPGGEEEYRLALLLSSRNHCMYTQEENTHADLLIFA